MQRIRQQLGLNDPIPVQYVRYMTNLAHGDLGTSLRHPGIKISELVFPKLWVSTQLLIIPTILTFALGLPIGVFCALWRGTWRDPTTIGSLLLVAAIPEIIMIPLLQWLFSLKLEWVPPGGWNGIWSTSMILPTIVLTIPALGGTARLMRASVLQVLDEDFVRTARAKGLAEAVVMVRHVISNAMLPIITGVVYALIFIFTGDFFVEYLFGIPGLGREILSAISSRDYDEFMAITILSAVAFIFANLLLDILYSVIDPRISLGGRS